MYPLTCFMLCADDLYSFNFLKEGPQVIRFAMLQKTSNKRAGQAQIERYTSPCMDIVDEGVTVARRRRSRSLDTQLRACQLQSRSLKTERQLKTHRSRRTRYSTAAAETAPANLCRSREHANSTAYREVWSSVIFIILMLVCLCVCVWVGGSGSQKPKGYICLLLSYAS